MGGAGRGRKRKDAAGDAQLAAEAQAVWWARTRAAMCGVLRRGARKRAKRAGGARGGGASGSGAHVAGSKRDAKRHGRRRWFDRRTDLQEVRQTDTKNRQNQADPEARTPGTPRQQGGINGKAPRVEYARQYPAREIVTERRAEATGPDRPKRKRVDGRAACYANSGEGAKRRCDATGRPPGRPPG